MGLQRARKYQTEGGARYLLRVIGHSSGGVGQLTKTEKELPVKKSSVRQDTSQTQYIVSPVDYVKEHGYTYTESLCAMNSSTLTSFMSVPFNEL